MGKSTSDQVRASEAKRKNKERLVSPKRFWVSPECFESAKAEIDACVDAVREKYRLR